MSLIAVVIFFKLSAPEFRVYMFSIVMSYFIVSLIKLSHPSLSFLIGFGLKSYLVR